MIKQKTSHKRRLSKIKGGVGQIKKQPHIDGPRDNSFWLSKHYTKHVERDI